LLTNVAPLTLNGRSPVDSTTAGAAPPRAPVKVWTLDEGAARFFAAETPSAALNASAAAWPVALARGRYQYYFLIGSRKEEEGIYQQQLGQQYKL